MNRNSPANRAHARNQPLKRDAKRACLFVCLFALNFSILIEKTLKFLRSLQVISSLLQEELNQFYVSFFSGFQERLVFLVVTT